MRDAQKSHKDSLSTHLEDKESEIAEIRSKCEAFRQNVNDLQESSQRISTCLREERENGTKLRNEISRLETLRDRQLQEIQQARNNAANAGEAAKQLGVVQKEFRAACKSRDAALSKLAELEAAKASADASNATLREEADKALSDVKEKSSKVAELEDTCVSLREKLSRTEETSKHSLEENTRVLNEEKSRVADLSSQVEELTSSKTQLMDELATARNSAANAGEAAKQLGVVQEEFRAACESRDGALSKLAELEAAKASADASTYTNL